MKSFKKIKFVLTFASIATLSTITVGSVISCSNNSSNLTIKQNHKKDISNEQLIKNILKNDQISANIWNKTSNFETILNNQNYKQILQSTITNAIIKKLVISSNGQLSRNELKNSIEIQINVNNKNYSLKNKVLVTIYYNKQELITIDVAVLAINAPVITFNKSQYTLNFQKNDTLNSFFVLPHIQNWNSAYELQYSLSIDGNQTKALLTQNTIHPFSFNQNLFNELIQNNIQYQKENYLKLKLVATVIDENNNEQISSTTQIIVQNNALFLYATNNNNNLQSINLNCYIGQKYYLNFKQYKTLTSSSKLAYCLIEEVNQANKKTIALNNNQYLSNQIQNTISQISTIAELGTVSYCLEIVNTKTKQIMMQSNTVTIDCNQQGGVTITNPNMNTSTSSLIVNLNDTKTCTLTINNNVPGITYNTSDIYYQTAANNNQWLPITTVSNLFNVTLKNNQLIFTNLVSNIGINIKLMNASLSLYSNIVTINTIAPNSMWTHFILNNEQNETFYPSNSNYNQVNVGYNEALNLKFLLPDINTSNIQYNWSILERNKFVSNQNNQANIIKKFSNGNYIVKLQINWDNDINISQLTYLFEVAVFANNNSIKTAKTKLQTYVNNESTLQNILFNFFETTPSALIPYINTWGYGWEIASNVNGSNFNKYFKIKNCLFNSNNLLQLKLQVLNSINLDCWLDNKKDATITSGATLIVTTPFTPNDFYNNSNISNTGVSEINVNINNAINKMSWYLISTIGWKLQNCNDENFNNKFVQLNLSVINKNAYSFTITTWNSNEALPNYCKAQDSNTLATS